MLSNRGKEPSLLLRNARIVTPGAVIERGCVLIDGGRIARLADSVSSEKLRADSEIDLSGQTLFPGFVDVHLHGAAGVDTLNAGADDLARVADFLARQGVTGWLPTIVPGSADEYRQAIRSVDQLMNEQSTSREIGARVLGIHYEGPFVNSAQCGALHAEHFRSFSGASDLEALPTMANAAAIHMMTVAPEIDGGVELVGELRRRGWIVSIGHTRANVEVLDRAREAGAHHLTHFMNAMAPLHQRTPGPVAWGLMNDDVTCDVIADGIHLDPLMLQFIVKTKTTERLSLISDAIGATGLGDGDYQIWGETISVENGRTRNRNGNIAGSVITILDAVRMMRSLGLADIELARMASLNPARLLGIDKVCGSIEEGKRADLIAVDEALKVELVIIDGLTVTGSRQAG